MRPLHIQRYLITGLLTIVPLWLTFVVFRFIFGLLSHLGEPLVGALLNNLSSMAPKSAALLGQNWVQSIVAFIVTVFALYLLGLASSRVLGARIIGAFENLISHIPMVHTIYGGTKKLMTMLSTKPAGTQRVVLIDFPSPELKSVGFVTRVFTDEAGREVAAVYVPTTPNPTGGYLEIVPVSKIIATDWSMDQAMAFILSGGAVGPDALPKGAHPEQLPPTK